LADAVRERVKVAIVGSGPAGLSAAAHAARLGLSHVLIEKADHLSDTIYKYQKGKHVMATPSNLVLRADLDFEAGKREAVLGAWDAQTGGHKVNVRYETEIVSITGEKGAFVLAPKRGEPIHAEAVILAIGTQGNPNLVRCPVGDGAVVQYQLDDPAEYIDEHIVVIGAGDAGSRTRWASPADPQQRNTVTIVNRSADFATAKDANVKALLAMQAEGRIAVLTETTASAIGRGEITFDTRDGERKAPATGSSRGWARPRRARSSRRSAPSSRRSRARRRSSRAPASSSPAPTASLTPSSRRPSRPPSPGST
jgi:thioredoxin reductase